DRNIAPEGRSTPTDEAADERFAELAAQAPATIGAERSSLGAPAGWSPPLEPPVELAAARFGRRLDLWWRRTSYTDITSEAHEAIVMSEPEQPALTDEPSAPTPVALDGERELALESPLGTMPVGVAFGTFVHRVLEATDFAADDLDAELAQTVAAAQARS